MKKLLLVILSMVCMQTAFADDLARLHVRIADNDTQNTYFLCVGSTDCVSIQSGDHGQVYPLDPGKINNMSTVNRTNMAMYTQPIPASCQAEVKAGETVTVTGQLKRGPNNTAYVDHLNCHIG